MSLVNELEKLAGEYRPSMDAEVLHSWASDLAPYWPTILSALREREAGPVAWLYEREDRKSEVALFRWRYIVDGKWRFGAEGWTETPLLRAGEREAE